MQVKVKPGWIVKDKIGLWWVDYQPAYTEHARPEANEWECSGVRADWQVAARCIVDPWPDKPDGGPECILEVTE